MGASLNTSVENEDPESLIVKYKKKRPDIITREAVHQLLKNGIWTYFVLLIIEGALRKWVLPGLATPLLIVRDPVAIWLLITAYRYDELPKNGYVWYVPAITVISVFTTLLFGHGSLVVAIYGARIFLFHFPLIFLIGRIFDRDDVIKMGKVLLWIAIPMTILIALQFYSPQGALINRGVGGDTQGGGFSGALGYFRPPGTFSFTTGNTQFFTLVAIFVIYFLLNPSYINKILLVAASISLVVAIPLSISRNLFVQVGITVLFAGVSAIRNPKYLGKVFIALMFVGVLFAILINVGFFANAIDTLSARFASASDSEGDLSNTFAARILAGFYEPFEGPLPFFGYGIGMGTNAGAQLLVGRSDEFLISEGEWGRLIGEMGAILGIAVIALRINICIRFIREAYKRLLESDLLPWIILSVSLPLVSQGQWAQPTSLGFAVLLGGLSIASAKGAEGEEEGV